MFLLTAGMWVIFGISSLVRTSGNYNWLLALLMFGNAGVLLWIGWGIKKQRRAFYYLALVRLAVNILFTITDQFGIFELIYLFLAGVLFVLLLVTKARYRQVK